MSHLNSRALVLYTFSRILDELERVKSKYGRLNRFEKEFKKAIGTVDARMRVPVSVGIDPALRNAIDAMTPFNIDTYPSIDTEKAQEGI